MFADGGFEQTTIADVACAADVAKMTVTNYFPLKEDLVFDHAATIVRLLAEPVATRPTGRSPLQALQEVYGKRLAAHDPILGVVSIRFAEMVESSPALLARARQL